MSAEFDVLVIMPRDLLRDGVCAAITEDADINTAAAAEPSAALDTARRRQPEVVLMSVEPDGRRAGFDLDLCRAIVGTSARSKILCLAYQPSAQLVDLAFGAGARGVFDLDLSLDLLVDALRTVKEGEDWTPRSFDSRDAPRPVVGTSPLTPRQQSVLVLLAQGLDHRAIAEELFVSPHTARTHIRNVMHKLGAHNRLEAVYLATDAGLLDQPAS